MHKLSPQYFSSCQFPATFLGQSNNYKIKIITFLLYFLRKLYLQFFSLIFFLLPNVSVHPFSLSFNCMASLFTNFYYKHVWTCIYTCITKYIWSACIVFLIYLSLGLRIWYCNINWCVLSWGRLILLHQVFLNYIHIFV